METPIGNWGTLIAMSVPEEGMLTTAPPRFTDPPLPTATAPIEPLKLLKSDRSSRLPAPFACQETVPVHVASAGNSASPPDNASTFIVFPGVTVMVVSVGRESRLFAPEASTRISSPPMLLRSLAVRAPPLAASSMVG